MEKVLADLKRRYSKSTEFSFTNGQYLALCLYILERDTHFTGDGIWNNGHNAKGQSLLPLKKINVAAGTDNDTVQSINDYLINEDSHNINDDFNTNDMDDHNDFDDEDKTPTTKRQHT